MKCAIVNFCFKVYNVIASYDSILSGKINTFFYSRNIFFWNITSNNSVNKFNTRISL